MRVNVIMEGQLDEHLRLWEPVISITLYFALCIAWLCEMRIKYDDDSGELVMFVVTDACAIHPLLQNAPRVTVCTIHIKTPIWRFMNVSQKV